MNNFLSGIIIMTLCLLVWQNCDQIKELQQNVSQLKEVIYHE